MRKALNFAWRSFLEIARDPLSIIFAILLPLFLLFIFQQFDIPSEVYGIQNFTPGIVIFGFSFISMFTATLVAKDRSSSFLQRLGVSPMRGWHYVVGYAISVLPLVLVQNILFFATALALGLDFGVSVIATVAVSLPVSVLFIFLGILVGSVTSEKSSAGLSSVAVQLVAFTSGIYFDSQMMGGFFEGVCKVLPFSHGLNILRTVLNSTGENLLASALIFFAYTLIVGTVSVLLLSRNR